MYIVGEWLKTYAALRHAEFGADAPKAVQTMISRATWEQSASGYKRVVVDGQSFYTAWQLINYLRGVNGEDAAPAAK